MYFWTSYLSYKFCQKLIISYMQLKRSPTSCTEASKLGNSPRQGQTVWDAIWTAYLSAVWYLYPPPRHTHTLAWKPKVTGFGEYASRWFWCSLSHSPSHTLGPLSHGLVLVDTSNLSVSKYFSPCSHFPAASPSLSRADSQGWCGD